MDLDDSAPAPFHRDDSELGDIDCAEATFQLSLPDRYQKMLKAVADHLMLGTLFVVPKFDKKKWQAKKKGEDSNYEDPEGNCTLPLVFTLMNAINKRKCFLFAGPVNDFPSAEEIMEEADEVRTAAKTEYAQPLLQIVKFFKTKCNGI